MSRVRYGIQAHRRSDGAALSLPEIITLAREVESAGLDSLWLTQGFDHDSLTALAVLGTTVPRLELGTAVVPTPPRHPVALALQALTAQSASGGRIALGIGPSHQSVMRDVYGLQSVRPASDLEEFLEVLLPLLRTGSAVHDGSRYKLDATVHVRGASPVPVLIGAMGLRLVRMAGRTADGVVTALVGPRMLGEQIVPELRAESRAMGRPGPRVVACIPACLTGRLAAAREAVDAEYAISMTLPIYVRNLAREGVASAADLSALGDEEDVLERIDRLIQAGATDIAVRLVGSESERRDTLALLGREARRSAW